MSDGDAYDELFVEDSEPRETILNAVKPYLRFTKDGEILQQDTYDDLSGRQQVLVLILATKVLEAKGLQHQEGMRVNDIVDITGMSKSTVEGYVYGKLKEVIDSDEGRLFVPNYKVSNATEELEVDGNGR